MVFGLVMPLIVMIPCGLIQAVTGIAVPLNVLAEFIGGAIVSVSIFRLRACTLLTLHRATPTL